MSERSRSNYCKIRKCWDVTALVLVTRLIVCRRQTDRQTDWRVREQTRLSLGGSHFCQESRMPNRIQIGSRHDGPVFASVRRSDMVQVPLAQTDRHNIQCVIIYTKNLDRVCQKIRMPKIITYNITFLFIYKNKHIIKSTKHIAYTEQVENMTSWHVLGAQNTLSIKVQKKPESFLNLMTFTCQQYNTLKIINFGQNTNSARN